MRIVHILNHCNHGHGNAHVAVDLACVQASAGHDVTYVSAGGDFESLLERSGVKSVYLPQRTGNPLHSAVALLRFVAYCWRFKPEIVHAHMMTGALIGYAAAKFCKFRLITTVHNSFDKHSAIMRLGHVVVAVSGAERTALIERGYPEDKVKTVLNGPNESPRESSSGDAGAEPDCATPCITTVCGLHRRKGVRDLIEAFSELHADFPEWHLNIVGDGPDRDTLEQLVGELGLTDKIHFLGMVDNPKGILRKSAIFVLASFADPCSLAVAEARFAGCAIVATAVGGTPELLEHGVRGRLVTPGKPEEIARELRSLMADPAELAKWRALGKEKSDLLTVRRVAKDYEGVYRDALTQSGT